MTPANVLNAATITSKTANPMFYLCVLPMSINVLLLTGACLIVTLFFTVSIVLSLISFMQHVVVHFFHARLLCEFNKV